MPTQRMTGEFSSLFFQFFWFFKSNIFKCYKIQKKKKKHNKPDCCIFYNTFFNQQFKMLYNIQENKKKGIKRKKNKNLYVGHHVDTDGFYSIFQ